MSNISTTNLPSGQTNAQLNTVLSTYGANDPTVFHQYFNDFDTYTAGDWTNTATGSVTNSIVAGDGGILSLANSAANNDLDSLQLTAATFQVVQGQQAWFKARFNVSNATNAALIVGLIQTTTTPLTVTNGIYFRKSAASTTLNMITTATSTSTTVAAGTMANTTYVSVGWWYDGISGIRGFLNGNPIGMSTANIPFATNLNLTLAVANGTGATNTLLVDNVFCSTERTSAQSV